MKDKYTLFERVTTDLSYRTQIYHQFCLDAKRISMYLEGKYDHSITEQCLYTWLINLFVDEQKGLWFVYWCTQTALGDIYKQKLCELNCDTINTHHHRYNKNNTNVVNNNHLVWTSSTRPHTTTTPCTSILFHLVDDGRQIVYIKRSSDQYEEATLYVLKPFRVCCMSHNDHLCTLYYIHLRVTIDTSALGSYDVVWIPYASATSLDVHLDTMVQKEDVWWIVS